MIRDLTVVIPTIPERADMLAEALDSCVAQTLGYTEAIIARDDRHKGTASTLNIALSMVKTEWVMVLDDDDLLDPNHIETLSFAERPDLDVIYSACHYDGGYWVGYDQPFDSELLMRMSIVPMTAAFRTHWWRDAGGYDETCKEFDWLFWRELAGHGAQFHKVNAATWTYRFHGANQSREGVMANVNR